MGLTPKIIKKKNFILKKCSVCGGSFGPENYTPTRSFLYPDGAIPMCNDCIRNLLEGQGFDWKIIDKLCQMVDVPFVPREVERMRDQAGSDFFPKYAEIFLDSEYDSLGWGDYYAAFKSLKEANKIEDELPYLYEQKRAAQKKRWGSNYDDEALDYLEELYNGLLTTQNINGKLQADQALKICKMSYEIDCRIREGADFDKVLKAYDTLVKTAEFTPKNVKNINDFDTCGELIKWLEKRGWKNKFFDSVSRDVVDETIQNIQSFNQRLYTNETGIGDEISRRIESLKHVKELETYYTEDKEYDLDNYDDIGYEELLKDDSEFEVELE